MTRHSLRLSAAIAVLFPFILVAQDESPDVGQITGNVQMLFQTYQEDSLIGAQVPPSKTGFNAFGNLIYTRGGFSAGMRYESYLDPILGYPGRFRGSGIGYRYLNYNKEHFEVTVGNFYEQFGSGLVLRAYEERQLGIDNALDGFRLVLRPTAGVTVKGLVGKQRFDFDSRLINSPGSSGPSMARSTSTTPLSLGPQREPASHWEPVLSAAFKRAAPFPKTRSSWSSRKM